MSKLYCAGCKYYDFNTCEGVDWCRLNNEETGICGHCEREFEDLDEATEHYEAVVKENNEFLSSNSEMAGKIKELEHRLANCIEPKFKIGQEVYTIDKSRANYIGTGTITEIRLDEFGIVYKFTIFKSNYSENYNYKKEQDLFATEEEARKKLEELKNE